MNKIFDTARKVNARIILSGDVRQHGSIEHGSALKQLRQKANLKIASVNKILRQRHNPDYKKAIDFLATGRMRMGLAKLEKMNAVVEIEDTKDRHKKIANDFVQSLEERRSVLVVSPTHAEGRLITEAIRAKMKEHGRISGIERSFTIQKNLSFSEAQKQDHALYEPGMRIQFHQNYKGGFKAGIKYDVVSKDKDGQIFIKSTDDKQQLILPKAAHERFQVFQKDVLNFSTGDLIRITNNGRSVEKSRVHNGQTFLIKGFTPEGNIQLSNGKTLHKNYANFTHGVVQTSYAVQGKDAHTVLVAMGSMSFAASNQKQFYVSASRATETIKIYTDDKNALREVVSKSGEQMSARDIADRQPRRKERRLRYYNQLLKKITKDDRKKERPKIEFQGPILDKR